MICTYESTRFTSFENDFCIFVYSTKDVEKLPKEIKPVSKGGVTKITATGYGLPKNGQIEVDLNGVWENSKHGLQLKVSEFKEIIPTTPDGIVGYLSSGLIKGIGKKTATEIVSRFGVNTIKIIETEPKKLLVINGITENKLADIVSSFEKSTSMRDLVSFLSPFEISYKKAIKIQKHFGNKSLETIKNHPFKLCEISGFGFLTVDKIARKLHSNLDDGLRIQSAVNYILTEASGNGHLFLDETTLKDSSYELLNNGFPKEVVNDFHIIIELDEMEKLNKILTHKGNVYLFNYFIFERETTKKIANMLAYEKKITFNNLPTIIDKTQVEQGINLAKKQFSAVEMCMNNNISIITGGPGTGKTTTLKVILEVYRKTFGGLVLLTAPTGRASRRMAESTGFDDSQTLHKALGLTSSELSPLEKAATPADFFPLLDDEFQSSDTLLNYNFIVVDEMSMVDMKLAYELFKRVRSGSKILMLGDPDQLPSVGAGNVLREMITCGIIPTTHLDTIFRQKSKSLIPVNAHLINSGNVSLEYGDDFKFIHSETPEETAQIIKNYFMRENCVDVQILTPLRSKTKASCYELNLSIRDIVNPSLPNKSEAKIGSRIFRYGDKVMQIKNKDGVSNGDVGFITNIQKVEKSFEITIAFSNDRIVNYTNDDMSMIDLAYAMTIHKSQGSEYETVIIPLHTHFFSMLKRNIIYTAVTRAKVKVIFIGQKKALAMAIKKHDIDARNTNLGKFINGYYKKIKKDKEQPNNQFGQMVL